MRDLMRDIVNRLYTFHLCADDPKLQAQIERWMGVAGKWDEPEIDHNKIAILVIRHLAFQHMATRTTIAEGLPAIRSGAVLWGFRLAGWPGRRYSPLALL